MAKKKKNIDDITKSFKKINEMGLYTKNENYISIGKPIIDSYVSGYTKVIKDKPIGYCRGKIYSFAGKSGIGKSTFVMSNVSLLVIKGHRVVVQDIENGINPVWIKNYGLEEYIAKTLEEFIDDKNKKLFVYNPSTYNEAMTTIFDILKITEVDCVVVDSFKQLAVDDVEDYINDIKSESKSSLMTAAKKDAIYFPFMRSLAKKYNIVVLGVQQMRVKNIGTSFAPNFVDRPAGSNSYDHNTDTRFIFKLVSKIKGRVINNKGEIEEREIGAEVKLESDKNRFGMHGLYLKLYFGKGISLAILSPVT